MRVHVYAVDVEGINNRALVDRVVAVPRLACGRGRAVLFDVALLVASSAGVGVKAVVAEVAVNLAALAPAALTGLLLLWGSFIA